VSRLLFARCQIFHHVQTSKGVFCVEDRRSNIRAADRPPTYFRVSAAPAADHRVLELPLLQILDDVYFISSVDFTSNPLRPIASVLMLLRRVDDDVPRGCLMPRLTTLYPLFEENDVDQILADIVHVAFTVASTIVPFCEPAFFSILGSRCATAAFITAAESSTTATAFLRAPTNRFAHRLHAVEQDGIDSDRAGVLLAERLFRATLPGTSSALPRPPTLAVD